MHSILFAEPSSLILILIAGLGVWLVMRLFSGHHAHLGAVLVVGLGLFVAVVVVAGYAMFSVSSSVISEFGGAPTVTYSDSNGIHHELNGGSGRSHFSSESHAFERFAKGHSRTTISPGEIGLFWPLVILGVGVLLALLLNGRTRSATLSACKILAVIGGICMILRLGFVGQFIERGDYADAVAINNAPFERTELSSQPPRLESTPPAIGVAEQKPAVSEKDSETPVKLPSVAADERPQAAAPAKPRPAWLSREEGREGNIYHMVVSSGRYATQLECDRKLGDEMTQAVQRYLESYLGDGAAEQIAIDPGYLRDHIKQAEFSEVVDTSVGPMHEVHALLEFNDQVQAYFREAWRAAAIDARLHTVGLIVAGVLAALAALSAYLKHGVPKVPKRSGGIAVAIVATVLVGCVFLVKYAAAGNRYVIAPPAPAKPQKRVDEFVKLNVYAPLGGYPARGHALFLQHCASCHSLFGEGNATAHDLTGNRERARGFLRAYAAHLDAPLLPEFKSYSFTDIHSQHHEGMIMDLQPGSLTVLGIQATRTEVSSFASLGVKQMTSGPETLVPDEVLRKIQPWKLRDLLSYLERGSPVVASAR